MTWTRPEVVTSKMLNAGKGKLTNREGFTRTVRECIACNRIGASDRVYVQGIPGNTREISEEANNLIPC